MMIAASALILAVWLQTATAAPLQKRSDKKIKSNQSSKAKMKTDSKEEPIFACRLDALDASQRERHKSLWLQLQDGVREIKELKDGYGFRFSSSPSTVLLAAEWITLERLCCPFFNFALEIEGDNESAWLNITGREGVKEFLRLEMNIK